MSLRLAWFASLTSWAMYAWPGADVRPGAQRAHTAAPPLETVQGRIEVLEKAGSTKDLDGAILWLEGSGLGAPQPQRLEIAMGDKTFRPGIVLAPVGSTIAFPNEDDFDHNVFSRSETRSFDLGLYGRGVSRSVTLDRAGLVNVYCNVHAKMAAMVLVHATPFATRADATGRFQIDGVPSGRYVLHAWHERGGERTMELTVPAAEAPVITLDARSYRFVQHLDKTGKKYESRGRRY